MSELEDSEFNAAFAEATKTYPHVIGGAGASSATEAATEAATESAKGAATMAAEALGAVTEGTAETVDAGAIETVVEGGAEKIAPTTGATPQSAEEFLASLQAAVAEQAKTRPAPEAKPQAPSAPDELPIYSNEELALLAEYEKDWSTVAKAEALRRKGEYTQLAGYIFQEIQRELGPIVKYVVEQAETNHAAKIRSAAPDYDNIYDQMVKWVDKQPTYLKNVYTQIMNSGTAEEAIDMLSRFRKEEGLDATAATPGRVAPTQVRELAPAAKKAALALAPTGSKQSTGVQAVNEDFDAAFVEFSRRMRL